MKKVVDLKQTRTDKIAEQEGFVNVAKAANRGMNSEEVTRFDALQNEIESLNAEIKRAEAFEANQAAKGVSTPNVGRSNKEASKNVSIVRAINALRSGAGLSGTEKEVHEKTVAEMRSQGLPDAEGMSFAVSRDFSVDGNSGSKGGALVASTPQLVEPLRPQMAIEELGVTVLQGLSGDVPLPSSGALAANFVGETGSVTPGDTTFAGPTLKPKRVAGVFDISNKLLAQGSIDVERYIIREANIAIGNAITVGALNGPGGDSPTGLFTAITENIDTTEGVPTHNTIVNLESLVDDCGVASRKPAYLCDVRLRGVLKTSKIDAGSGVFLSNGKELNSQPLVSTSLVPTLDAGASHPIIFGDWSQLFVGYWGGITFKVDPYTQAASGKTRIIVEAFVDAAVANQKAFAINKKAALSA